MDWKSERIRLMFLNTSRRIGTLSILMLIGSGIVISFNIESWLGLKLFQLGVLLFSIVWIGPGVLIILRAPWLAYAWLRGYNPLVYSLLTWEQLSDSEKIEVNVNSLVIFFIIAILAPWAIISNIIK